MDNTREKLIELLETVVSPKELLCDGEVLVSTSRVADHLIAHGVTFATDNNVGSKWIPVTERLPKREDANLYESVLAINKEDGVPRSWIWDIVVDYPKEFTHWMPLPEPPKGE